MRKVLRLFLGIMVLLAGLLLTSCAQTFNVTLEPENNFIVGGSVDLEKVLPNFTLSLTVVVPDGKEVDEFTVDGEIKELDRLKFRLVVTGNHIVKVTFKDKEKFSLTLGEGITANIENLTNIEDGEDVLLTITPPEGKEIYQLIVDGKAVDLSGRNTYRLTVSNNHVVSVNFRNISTTDEGVIFITNVDINNENELVVTFSDGEVRNLGKVSGEDGAPGVGIDTVSFNDSGELLISYTNGESQNLGRAVGLNGEKGADGKEVSLRVESGNIQWSYVGSNQWTNLIALTTLTGAKGADGREATFRVDSGFLQWSYVGTNEWTNLIKLSELTQGGSGNDGREVTFRVANDHIQWSYAGTNEWTDLIDLVTLTGPKGEAGTDGKEVRLRVDSDYIQWSYVGSDVWTNLIDIATLTGADGAQGANGKEVTFRVNGDHIQWSYAGSDVWTNLIDIATLTGADGQDGVSITNTEINANGELVVTYSDNTTKNLGKLFKSYVVQFIDYNNYVLKVEHVLHGHGATAPSNPEREGYTFSGWNGEYNSITGNSNIYATYEIKKFTVDFESNGGGECATISNVEYGNTIVLPAPTKEGYHFKGWYLEDGVNDKQFTNLSKVEASLTLYARWELKSYLVSFYDDSNVLIKTEHVFHGDSANPPAIDEDKAGYTYNGWDKDISNVKSDLIVKPNFTPNTNTPYKVYYYHQTEDLLGYELHETANLVGETDAQVDATIKTYTGFNFDGDNTSNVLSGNVVAAGTLELKVYYNVIILEVNFYNINEELIDSIDVLYGKDVVAPGAPLVSGYTFLSWSESLENIIISKDIYSNYTANDYKITLLVNGGDPLVNDEVDVVYDSAISGLPVPTRTGHTFLKWVDNLDQEYQNGTVYQVADNINLTAVWQANDSTYRVNHYMENLSGVYELDNFEVIGAKSGQTVNAVIQTHTGFNFNSSHTSSKTSGVVLLDNSLTLSVYYKREVYTVSFADYDGTNLKSQLVKYLGAATAPTNPSRDGHTFAGWSIPFNAVTGNLEVVAQYNVNSYTITFDAAGGNFVAQQTHDYNTLVTLPTPVRDGYEFTGWLLEDQVITQVYLTSNISLMATWILNQYTITLNTDGGDPLDDLTVQFGTVVSSLPTPTRTDYAFVGWTYNNLDLVLPFTFTEEENIEFKAKWSGLSEGITYEVVDQTYVKIISYVGAETNLIIPNTISGYPVTIIGPNAFKDNATIQTLKFGNHITTVGNQAFYQMASLKQLKLPSSAQTFGTEVLHGSNALEHLVISGDSNYQLKYYFGNNESYIPATLDTLEFAAGTLSLNLTLTQNDLGDVKHIIIPDSVEQIELGTFAGAAGLTKVTVPFVGKNRSATGNEAIFGYIFGTSSYMGSTYTNGYYVPSGLVEVTITDATIIGDTAFKGCSTLTKITISDNVTGIGEEAFFGCSSLTSITIPNAVLNIGPGAFNGCGGLTEMTLPFVGKSRGAVDNETKFGYIFGTGSYTNSYKAGDYYIPTNLVEITITDAMVIHSHAFDNCISLEIVTISNSLMSIGGFAFFGCKGITKMTLPFTGISRTETDWERVFGVIFGYQYFEGSYGVAIGFRIPYGLTEVIITDTDYIGSQAFQYCHSLTSITLPDSVKTIGAGAFEGCTGLTGISIPNGVTSIEGTSFKNCTKLTSIVIPNSITRIESSTFEGCIKLASITLPDTITSIGESAFQNCSALTAITLPDNLTSIGASIFAICTELVSIALPDGITNIPSCAFISCGKLESITIPNGVTSIGGSAFDNCSSLTSISIPNSVTSIGDHAFFQCNGLTKMTLPFIGSSRTAIGDGVYFHAIFGSDPYYVPNGLKEVIITDTTSIAEEAFKGCNNITKITIPNKVNTIDVNAFKDCSGLTEITIPFVGASRAAIGDNAKFEYLFGGLANVPASLIKVTITDTTNIPQDAFNGCGTLTSVTIPNGVTTIGNNAFKDCNDLTSMVIPSSVTSIGTTAFSGCTGLTKMTIPFVGASKTATGDNAKFEYFFGGAANVPIGLTEVIITNATNIAQDAFAGCDKITKITIPDSVLSIGASAFSGCAGLTEMTLPFVGKTRTATGTDVRFGYIFGTTDYLGSYEANIYYIPNSLITVTITDTTKIGNDAFKDCNKITSITLPTGVASIGQDAFNGCSGLLAITIPDAVTSIGDTAFAGCSGLTSISISNNVTSIGAAAFNGCKELTEMTLPFVGKSKTATGTDARFGYIFGKTAYTGSYEANTYHIPIALTKVTITDATSISDYAFSGCDKITNLSIPTNVGSIGEYAFSDCSGLTEMVLPTGITKISCGTFWNCSNLTTITIPIGVTNIDTYAFYGCSGLGKVTIPNSVISLGNYVFHGCHGLTEVTIPFVGKSREATDDEAIFGYIFGSSIYSNSYVAPATGYYLPNSLTKVIITDTTSIADSAFTDCFSLDTITIPTSVTSIGAYAFAYSNLLANIEIPEGVVSIGAGAFKGCSSLATITIPENITSIGESIFSGCSALLSIEIPVGVTSIGTEAFKGCKLVTSVTIPTSVTSIGASAFNGCAGLTEMTIPFIGSSRTATGDEVRFGYIFGTADYSGSYEANTYRIPTNLTTLTITDTTSIGNDAFKGCTKFTSITLPNSVTIIGSDAFSGCTGFSSITLPTSITVINERTFDGCNSLTGIVIPNSVTIIGGAAFRGCSDLETIKLPNNLRFIGEETFHNCGNLAKIVIPTSVTSIGANAFKDCTGLNIYTEVVSKPIGWDANWNVSSCPVHWGGTWHYDEYGNPVANT